MKAINKRTNQVIATNIIEANTFLTRLKGLIGKKELTDNDGLLLIPCNQVHTYFMNFPLSIWFLTEESQLIHAIDCLDVGILSEKVKSAYMVLELPAYSLTSTGTEIGDIIYFEN